jgi:hypothetical protein
MSTEIKQSHSPAKVRDRVPVIRPNAVYSLELARHTLLLAKNCLPREIRLGRLRVAKRAGKYLILGKWLLEWIAAGEVTRRKAGAVGGVSDPQRHAEPESY